MLEPKCLVKTNYLGCFLPQCKQVKYNTYFMYFAILLVDETATVIWRAELSFPADCLEFGPYDITASLGNSSNITLHNILFGEVWFCSGQSNMNFLLKYVSDYGQVKGCFLFLDRYIFRGSKCQRGPAKVTFVMRSSIL